jgi:hypothetical protein
VKLFANAAYVLFPEQSRIDEPDFSKEKLVHNPYSLLAKKSNLAPEKSTRSPIAKTQNQIPDGYDEISTARYIVSGIFSTFVGLGTGQFIQLRPLGFVFLLGEPTTMMLFVLGAFGLDPRIAFLGGAGYVGLRIWDAVDAWSHPMRVNGQLYGETKKRKHLDFALPLAQVTW